MTFVFLRVRETPEAGGNTRIQAVSAIGHPRRRGNDSAWRGFMIAALLALQIVSSAPPVSPGEAARILRDGPGLSNRTAPPAPIAERGPVVLIIGGSPTAGPFGEFKPFGPTAPLSRGPYVFRSPAPYRFRPRFEPVQVTSTMRALRTRR